MAGLIKNQLLKHLSKFAKNLTPSSINLSTLKGEGELRDLELNEAVLTDLLDLPTWLRLSKATCNRVNLKIQWTKLKSQAICLYLDEVEVHMETCDEPRTPTAESPMANYGAVPGKYGMAESIIDGMYVSINSVIVNFRAKTFVASIQLSRIIIQSKAPTWHTEENLRLTRIKDERRGEIIIFKEAEWMTLRIEANALEGAEPHQATTPLRLIANQSKIRITIKKKLSDCGIIASRLHVNLDDLLWVLTDSQLKAALVFMNSLSGVIEKSSKQSKKMAAAKIKKQGHAPSPVKQGQRQNPQKAGSRAQQAISKLFEKFDIRETSYHLYTGRIDLHLCDDAAPEDADHRRKVEGGAMQVTLFKMGLDSYPYHPAGTDRSHWLKYDKNMEKRDQWATELLTTFKEDVRKVREEFLKPKPSQPSTEKPSEQTANEMETGHRNVSTHIPVDRDHRIVTQGQGQGHSNFQGYSQGQTASPHHGQGHPHRQQGQGHIQGHPQGHIQGQSPGHQPVRPPSLGDPAHGRQGRVTSQGHPQHQGHVPQQGQAVGQKSSGPRPTKLLESCMVFRLEDFALYRVSTALDHKRSVPKKFMTSDKQRLFLPPEMSSVHIEFTEYYFPEGIDYPRANVPQSNPKAPSSQTLKVHESPDSDDFVIVDEDDSFLTSFVPHGNTYVLVNPIYLKLDFLTVLWLNAFVLNLLKKANVPESEGPKIHQDVRIEALMPRIVLPIESETRGQSDRPGGLQIQASQIAMSNCRIGDKASRLQLLRTLDEFNRGRLFKDSSNQFPRDAGDFICVPSNFMKHLDKEDSPYFDKSVESVLRGQGVPNEYQRATNELLNPLKKSQSITGLTYYNMMSDSFKLDATKDVWCVSVDQLWLEFVGVPSSRNRPVPFVEAFPLTIWISRPLLSLQSESSVCVPSQSNSSISSSGSADSSTGEKSKDPTRSRSRQLLKDYYHFDKTVIPNGHGESQSKDANHHETSTKTDSQTDRTENVEEKPDTQSVERLAEVHIVTNLSSKISVQLNHYQYLFLMRLVDAITKMLDEMDDDTIFITKAPLPESKASISVIVKEVEVALICPPIPEIPSLQISPEDSEELQDMFSAAVHGKGSTGSQFMDTQLGDRGDSALGVSLHSGRSHDCSNGTLVHKSSSEIDVFSDDSPSDEVTNDLFPMPGNHGNIPSTTSLQSDMTDASHDSPLIHISDVPSSSPSHYVPATAENRSRSGSPASRASPAHSTSSNGPTRGQQHGTPRHDPQRKDTDIKKSITAFSNFTKGVAKKINKSVTDKVKHNMNRRDHLDPDDNFDDLETASMRSGSSDEDDYIMTKFQNQSEAPAFESKFNMSDEASVVESMSEIRDLDGASTRTLTGPLDRAQGVVSVVCFKLHNSEITISTCGKDVRIAATVDHVIPEEHGNVNLDKFHDRFLSANRENKSFSVESLPRLSDSPIRVRFLKGPSAEKLVPSSGEKGFLRAEIQDFHAKFLTSTLGSLGDLFDDEKPPDIVPMFVRVENTTVVIKDNKPPIHEITPTEKDPIELCVSKILIRRKQDGQFNITVDESADQTKASEVERLKSRIAELEAAAVTKAQQSWPTRADMDHLQEENDHLRRHLEKIGKMSTASGGFNIEALQEDLEKWKVKAGERKVLKKANEELMGQLEEKMDEVLMLKQERESLLATMALLQEELSQSEQQRYRSGHH